MKAKKAKNSIVEFENEEIRKQEHIKGGPEGSRGTTTTVQSSTGNG